MFEKVASYAGIFIAVLAVFFSIRGDKRIEVSMNNINTSMAGQIEFLERIDCKLDLTEVTSALWNDNRTESYLAMLSGNHAYGGENGRYVDYSSPPNRRFEVTEEGNNLLAGVDSKLKNRLSDLQKEHPDWSPAGIIRSENLVALQALLKSYNQKSGQLPVDLLTLVRVITAFLVGG